MEIIEDFDFEDIFENQSGIFVKEKSTTRESERGIDKTIKFSSVTC